MQLERAPARLAAELRDSGTLAARLVRGQSVLWEGVTDLRIEDENEREIRYRSINSGGEEHGAPRVLEVGEDSMVYQRISARRELAGKPRSCPMIVFLANFMPEAAAY